MCTAYELGKRGGSFSSAVNATALDELLDAPRIVRPTHRAPVLTADGEFRHMHWGFRRAFAAKAINGKPVWRTIVNSREDKLAGPTWRDSFAQRRCLIPASAFYEWVVADGRKVPLRFERPDGLWLWIAGIWELSQEDGLCFSMITTDPSPQIGPVHDRMPAVLDDSRIMPFLDGRLSEFGPSPVDLAFAATVNFLKQEDPPPMFQPELF